ncbi:hypothetical protein H696_04295 [Fonticula alba]|uniref:Dynactin subunit 4 n=1 Tax=Fonticula alba TaxID=691883 RepID=A0A058Z5T2_FONAL|nr:hypothetical protein H696_04295 [Fonticula alba]KCV68877.1 hypothetical protein H696_04295 [Fonticula alba]|eukprot:XP_009496448.1 hypothetical protein H696_04295 [Fonticula alba]
MSFQIPFATRVLYECACCAAPPKRAGAEDPPLTDAPDNPPRALEELFFCDRCQSLRCESCLAPQQTNSWHCPRCLSEAASASFRTAKGQCARPSCQACPACGAMALLPAGSAPMYLICQNCQWSDKGPAGSPRRPASGLGSGPGFRSRSETSFLQASFELNRNMSASLLLLLDSKAAGGPGAGGAGPPRAADGTTAIWPQRAPGDAAGRGDEEFPLARADDEALARALEALSTGEEGALAEVMTRALAPAPTDDGQAPAYAPIAVGDELLASNTTDLLPGATPAAVRLVSRTDYRCPGCAQPVLSHDTSTFGTRFKLRKPAFEKIPAVRQSGRHLRAAILSSRLRPASTRGMFALVLANPVDVPCDVTLAFFAAGDLPKAGEPAGPALSTATPAFTRTLTLAGHSPLGDYDEDEDDESALLLADDGGLLLGETPESVVRAENRAYIPLTDATLQGLLRPLGGDLAGDPASGALRETHSLRLRMSVTPADGTVSHHWIHMLLHQPDVQA